MDRGLAQPKWISQMSDSAGLLKLQLREQVDSPVKVRRRDWARLVRGTGEAPYLPGRFGIGAFQDSGGVELGDSVVHRLYDPSAPAEEDLLARVNRNHFAPTPEYDQKIQPG